MPKIIYKYTLQLNDLDQPFAIPKSARVISVYDQQGFPTLWMEVNLLQPETMTKYYRVFGTGHQVPDNYFYLGSTHNARYVWHIYERLENYGANWTSQTGNPP